MEKEAFLTAVDREYQTLQNLLSRFSAQDMEQPDRIGRWSLKDLLAHILWHEREMIGVLAQRALIGSPWWELSTDERNERITQEFQAWSLERVQQEARRVHQTLLEWLNTLEDSDLNDPSRFAHFPPDWSSGVILAQNTFEHYADHARDLVRLLESKKSSPGSGSGEGED